MTSWKTTIAGIAGCLLLWLQQIQGLVSNGTPINWWNMVLGLLILLIGYFAKDWNITGTGS
jgi:hypothetical protein